jgi:two-component system, sporulation sensor kinase A
VGILFDPFGSDQSMFLILSLMISILTSYSMFHFVSSMSQGSAFERRYGMLGGAAVFGFGMTSMHFVAMLAWDYMVTMDWQVIFVFALGAVLAYVSFLFYGSDRRFRIVLASASLSAGAVGMHFFNMVTGSASRFEVEAMMFLLSLAISFSGTYCAYYWLERRQGRSKLTSGVLMGSSTVAMMMVGMEAVTVEYRNVMSTDRLNDTLVVLVAIIGIFTMLVPGGSLLAWVVNKRFNMMDERYKLLVENSMDMIAIFADERWVYVNGSGLSMFQAHHEREMLGKSIYAFLHPKHHEGMRARLDSWGKYNAHGPLEQEWYTVSGKLLHTEVVETPTTLAGRPAVQVIIRDISERKKNEELLINSEKLYVAGQLAAGIAHEIRNPLTSLKGFLQLMESGRTANRNYYDIMKSELVRIESIVSELLMLSKPQIYELAEKDVREIMEDTVTLLEAQAIMHDIEIDYEGGSEALWVFGVENQIKQVFINVIKNAIEAMIDGGAIHVRCMREGDEVIVRIRDEGPGIASAQLSKMGQPFYTTKEKGTGLGLMVSYKIVDNHRGRIAVLSEVGKGTTMDVVLPYQRATRD